MEKLQKERRKKTERSLIMQMSVPRLEADALHRLPWSSLFFSGGKSPDFRVLLKTGHRSHPTCWRNVNLQLYLKTRPKRLPNLMLFYHVGFYLWRLHSFPILQQGIQIWIQKQRQCGCWIHVDVTSEPAKKIFAGVWEICVHTKITCKTSGGKGHPR